MSSISCPHLFTCHQVGHAFNGSQSDLVVLLKHVVLNLRQSLLFHYLRPAEEMKVKIKNPKLSKM